MPPRGHLALRLLLLPFLFFDLNSSARIRMALKAPHSRHLVALVTMFLIMKARIGDSTFDKIYLSLAVLGDTQQGFKVMTIFLNQLNTKWIWTLRIGIWKSNFSINFKLLLKIWISALEGFNFRHEHAFQIDWTFSWRNCVIFWHNFLTKFTWILDHRLISFIYMFSLFNSNWRD